MCNAYNVRRERLEFEGSCLFPLRDLIFLVMVNFVWKVFLPRGVLKRKISFIVPLYVLFPGNSVV